MSTLHQLSFVWPLTIRCKRCGFEGTSNHFHPATIHKSGLTGRCRRCVAQRRRANRPRHAQRIQAEQARYRAKHAEALAEKNRQYNATHAPPPRTAQDRATEQAWRDANREMVNAYAASTRSRRQGAVIVEHVRLDVLYARDKGICQLCLEPCDRLVATRDHILAPRDGGEHSYANIQLAHHRCNTLRGIHQREARRHRSQS